MCMWLCVFIIFPFLPFPILILLFLLLYFDLHMKIHYHRPIEMADINNNNNNAAGNTANIPPVHRAACMNNVQELKRLIEEEGHSPTSLFGNVRQQDGEGPDICTWTSPFSLAMANGDIKTVTYLLDWTAV